MAEYSSIAVTRNDTNRDSSGGRIPQGDDRESRIRTALRLVRGPLPHVNQQWLSNYFEYLVRRLPFPFEAGYFGTGEQLPESVAAVVAVTLLDPRENPDSERTGLLCNVRLGTADFEVPLVDLEVAPEHAVFQDLDDYWYWFWNWRFDPRI